MQLGWILPPSSVTRHIFPVRRYEPVNFFFSPWAIYDAGYGQGECSYVLGKQDMEVSNGYVHQVILEAR